MNLKNIKLDLENKKITITNVKNLKGALKTLHSVFGDDIVDEFDIVIGDDNVIVEEKAKSTIATVKNKEEIDTTAKLLGFDKKNLCVKGDFSDYKKLVSKRSYFIGHHYKIIYMGKSRIDGYAIFELVLQEKPAEITIQEAVKTCKVNDKTDKEIGYFKTDLELINPIGIEDHLPNQVINKPEPKKVKTTQITFAVDVDLCYNKSLKGFDLEKDKMYYIRFYKTDIFLEAIYIGETNVSKKSKFKVLNWNKSLSLDMIEKKATLYVNRTSGLIGSFIGNTIEEI